MSITYSTSARAVRIDELQVVREATRLREHVIGTAINAQLKRIKALFMGTTSFDADRGASAESA